MSPAVRTRPDRPPLRRPVDGRWLTGVAAGTAAHLRLPVAAVRLGFVLLACFAGTGVLVYGLLWALVAPDTTAGDGPHDRPRSRRWTLTREARGQLLWGVGFLVAGGLMLASRAGLPVPAETLVPAALAVTGAAVSWAQLDTTQRGRWLSSAGGGTREGAVRLGAGVVLAVVGILLLVAGDADAAALRSSVLATVAVLGGVGLLLAPWWLRLWRDLSAERAARVREAERAEVAAHLHDSVLQTLALIQRRSDDPTEVARLARAQERDLRSWLYGGAGPSAAGTTTSGPVTLAAQVRACAAEIEDAHGVPVEVVTVGDRPADDGSEPLVLALREATLNAVRHGRPPVQVYVEAGPQSVDVFVRDHGDGFELDRVPPDRLGVRESVIGRMVRAGGAATVRRMPDGGTEVALRCGWAPRHEPAARARRRTEEDG